MTIPSTLLGVLEKRYNISRAINERKERLLSLSQEVVRAASSRLMKDGHRVNLIRGGLLIRDPGPWLVYVAPEVDLLEVKRLEVGYSPKEVFVVCWSAGESLIELALRGSIHLALLSRGQVIHGDTQFSRLVLEFFRDAGVELEKFRHLGSSEDPLKEESLLLASYLTFTEKFREELERDLDDKVLSLVEELADKARRGADELEMNELLVAILQAYPADVDEDRSGKPGMPDVIAYSPLWVLFELKNETASRKHADQLEGYVSGFKGRATSPLGVKWRGLLVATGATPDTYAYAVRRGVRLISWDVLVRFLREVFSKGVPLELLRDALTDGNVERRLEALTSEWEKRAIARWEVLKLVREFGGISKEELASELVARGFSFIEELEDILTELSSPLLGVVREEDGIVVPWEGDPLPRALRTLRYLRRWIDA